MFKIYIMALSGRYYRGLFYNISNILCKVMQLMQWPFKAIIQSTSLCDMVESLAYWSGQMIYCCIWIIILCMAVRPFSHIVVSLAVS